MIPEEQEKATQTVLEQGGGAVGGVGGGIGTAHEKLSVG
jgi:hypothetical protein